MDKAVILAAGLGTRMRRAETAAALTDGQAAAAATGVKALIPIDRPFLDYVLSNVADAGYERVCLVIGPRHDQLRQYYTHLKCRRLQFEFAVQREPLGTANALAAAAEFAGTDPVLMLNSDNHYPTTALRQLRQTEGNAVAGFDRDGLVANSNIPAERIAKFAIIEPDEAGCLRRIVEKPDPTLIDRLPPPVLVNMNCWRFGPEIFAACDKIEKSERGEYEIPDAVTYAIQQLGQRFRVLVSTEPVLDLSHPGDVAAVTDRLKETKVDL